MCVCGGRTGGQLKAKPWGDMPGEGGVPAEKSDCNSSGVGSISEKTSHSNELYAYSVQPGSVGEQELGGGGGSQRICRKGGAQHQSRRMDRSSSG